MMPEMFNLQVSHTESVRMMITLQLTTRPQLSWQQANQLWMSVI